MFKILIFSSILVFSFLLAANVAPPVVEYARYDGGIIDVPESVENSNTIYRDADLDSLFDIQHEMLIYRATLEDDEITKIVKFNIDEENKTYYSSLYHFVFSDHCVEPGKYLYISDLDCSKFKNEFRSVQCQNYAEIEFEEPTDTTLCNPDKYEEVELTEDQINTLKTRMSGKWATLEIEEGDLYFVIEAGSDHVHEVRIKNHSDEFKSSLALHEDRFPKEPFYVFLPNVEGGCKDGLILSPLESCKLFIRFAPETAGDYEDSFWFQDSYLYYDSIKLTGSCPGGSSDGVEDNPDLQTDEEIHISDNDLETNDDAVIGENRSDGCSLTVL